MVVYNYSGKEINAKIVYYGPALSGKTTNLEWIYSKIPVEYSGKMVSLRTQADRTIFFDFLPLDLGMIDGFRTRFMLYTVPGQVHYNATRKMVLKGVDGLVFVADSEPGRMQDNIESLQNLRDNLQELGMNPDSLPLVLQWNKRDLPGCMDVTELERELNPRALPSFEACALTGEGVYETLHKASRLIYSRMTGDQAPALPSGAEDESLFGDSIAERLQDVDYPEPEPERVAVAPVNSRRNSASGADALGAILGGTPTTPSRAEPIEEAAIEIPALGSSAPIPAVEAREVPGASSPPAQPASPPPAEPLPADPNPASLDGLVEDVLLNSNQNSPEVDSVSHKQSTPDQGRKQETVADRLDSYFQTPENPGPRPAAPTPAPAPPQPPADFEASAGSGATEGLSVEHDVDVIEELADDSSKAVDLEAMFSEIGAVPVKETGEAPASAEPSAPQDELEDLGLITDPRKTQEEARAISQSVTSISQVPVAPFPSSPVSSPSGGPGATRILEVPVTLDQSVLEQGGSIRIVLNVSVK
jgi:signal recognition particle receptor subunit beta